MAELTYYPVGARQRNLVLIAGSFQPNGSSAIDNTLNTAYNKGWSVARTNAGIYTITLSKGYTQLITANATLQMNSATDLVLQWGAIDVTTATGGTLVLNALAATTPTDIASNANNRVFFALQLLNSGSTTALWAGCSQSLSESLRSRRKAMTKALRNSTLPKR